MKNPPWGGFWFYVLFFLLGNEEDEHEGADEEHHGVVEVGDYVKGTELETHCADCGERNENLRAVGQDALEDAGEGVEDRGGLSWRNAVFLREGMGQVIFAYVGNFSKHIQIKILTEVLLNIAPDQCALLAVVAGRGS